MDESMLELLWQKEDIFNTYARDSAVSDAFDQYKLASQAMSENELAKNVLELEQYRLEKRKKR